jgi:glycosyltransferase involved in cell wall biosynthesis
MRRDGTAERSRVEMAFPPVTVLIDAYNYGNFIEAAIDSVLAQDFPQDQVEIVVVDDGSTDDTRGRVAKYGERVRYLWKENGGQASAFNLGFAQARGEIIATLDADDYFLPGKLRRIAEEFEKHRDAGMVYHARRNLTESTGAFSEPEFFAESGFLGANEVHLLRYELYPTSCLAFRRDVVRRLLPIPESLRIQADGHLVLLMPLIAPVMAVTEPLSVYRLHGRNLFFLDERTAPVEERRKWIASFRRVIDEGAAWAAGSGAAPELAARGIKTERYFERFRLNLRVREFALEKPTRWELFRFLLRRNWVQRPVQSWRGTIAGLLHAIEGLALGYRGEP